VDGWTTPVGARIEHVHDGQVATLVYKSRLHVIDVFVWPGEARAASPVLEVQRGFNVLHWTDGSMQFWAVSDVERTELERLMKGLTAAGRQ
jgi:anti-sigma factor RsiW